LCDDVQLCNCCVREFLILARTWFAFGLPSKTGCDTKVLDLAMKIAKKMFLKMKEEDAKKKAEEEESRRKAEEDRGKGKIEYNGDLVELLVSRVMSKVSINTLSPSFRDLIGRIFRSR
jgi:hypothetical protein